MSGRRGMALLLVIVAVGLVDAMLAVLWLWSRAEARDAVESLAVGRAEWAAAASMTDALVWIAGRDSLVADTVLVGAGDGPDVGRRVTLRRVTDALVELRATARVPATGPALVTRSRCAWLVRGAADTAGVRPFRLAAGVVPASCW